MRTTKGMSMFHRLALLTLLCSSTLSVVSTSVSAQLSDDYWPDANWKDSYVEGGVLTPNAASWLPLASGPRKLVPATHPDMRLQGRWLRGYEAAWDFFPYFEAGNVSGMPAEHRTALAEYGARTYNCAQMSTLRFMGASSVSIHYYNFTGRVIWNISPGDGKWSNVGVPDKGPVDVLAANNLTKSVMYEISVLHMQRCDSTQQLHFIGIGLDWNTESTPVSPAPDLGTLEFVGDSVTAITMLDGSTNFKPASIPWVACLELGMQCSLIARSGADLMDYLDPKDPLANPLGVGTEWRARRLERRKAEVLPRAGAKKTTTKSSKKLIKSVATLPKTTKHKLAGSFATTLSAPGFASQSHTTTSSTTKIRIIKTPRPPANWTQPNVSFVGLSWAYFRTWFPVSNADRKINPPPVWDFPAQGFIPKAVIINLGINDRARAFMRPPEFFQDQFIRQYVAMVKRIRRVYGPFPKIVVLMPFGRRLNNQWIEVFPEIVYQKIAEGAQDPGLVVFNTTGWINNGNHNTYIHDRVHPNAAGMVYLGGKVAGALRWMFANVDGGAGRGHSTEVVTKWSPPHY